MSILSSFIRNQFLTAIEQEFNNHLPEMQAVILTEVETFANETLQWVAQKIKSKVSLKEKDDGQ